MYWDQVVIVGLDQILVVLVLGRSGYSVFRPGFNGFVSVFSCFRTSFSAFDSLNIDKNWLC